MRKIKDNGRTYKLVTYSVMAFITTDCHCCSFRKGHCPDIPCGYNGHWRETLSSRLSRFIKRMVRK